MGFMGWEDGSVIGFSQSAATPSSPDNVVVGPIEHQCVHASSPDHGEKWHFFHEVSVPVTGSESDPPTAFIGAVRAKLAQA
jgi:hypothetical protein